MLLKGGKSAKMHFLKWTPYLFFASSGVFAKLHFDYADPVLSSQRQEDVKSATRQRRVSDKTNRLGELQINACEK